MGPMLKVWRSLSSKSLASQNSSGSDDGQSMSRTPSSGSISNKYSFPQEPGHFLASPNTPSPMGPATPTSRPAARRFDLDDDKDRYSDEVPMEGGAKPDRQRYLLLAAAIFFVLPFWRTLLALLVSLLVPSFSTVCYLMAAACLVGAISGSPQLRRSKEAFWYIVKAAKEPLRHLVKVPENITLIMATVVSINNNLKVVRKDVQNIRARVAFLPTPAKTVLTAIYKEDIEITGDCHSLRFACPTCAGKGAHHQL